MLADQQELHIAQRRRLGEDLGRHTHLADVVHLAGEDDGLAALPVQAELVGDGRGQRRHPPLMRRSVGVAHADDGAHGLDGVRELPAKLVGAPQQVLLGLTAPQSQADTRAEPFEERDVLVAEPVVAVVGEVQQAQGLVAGAHRDQRDGAVPDVGAAVARCVPGIVLREHLQDGRAVVGPDAAAGGEQGVVREPGTADHEAAGAVQGDGSVLGATQAPVVRGRREVVLGVDELRLVAGGGDEGIVVAVVFEADADGREPGGALDGVDDAARRLRHRARLREDREDLRRDAQQQLRAPARRDIQGLDHVSAGGLRQRRDVALERDSAFPGRLRDDRRVLTASKSNQCSQWTAWPLRRRSFCSSVRSGSANRSRPGSSASSCTPNSRRQAGLSPHELAVRRRRPRWRRATPRRERGSGPRRCAAQRRRRAPPARDS